MGLFSDLLDDFLDPGKRAREIALTENRRQGDEARSRLRTIASGTGFASNERLARLDASVLASQNRQTQNILGAHETKSQLGGILGTLGGALIGSFIAPGAGTAAGASIGGSLFGGDPGLANAFSGGGGGGGGNRGVSTQGLVNFDQGGPQLFQPPTGPSSQGAANTQFLFPGLFGGANRPLSSRF